MYDGLSSPNIYNVKTMADYASVLQLHPDATIWAGGTFIMSRPNSYPSRKANEEIIYLGEMSELKRTLRNDRLLEYGAMVNLNYIVSSNRSVLPSLLEQDILSIGSSLVTSRATIGGAICTSGLITSITGTLIALNANMEIRYAKKKRMHSKWVAIAHSLDKNGRISLPSKCLVTRVRIGLNNADIQRFFSIGSMIKNPDQAVCVAFSSNWNQDILVSPRLAITFPLFGICYSRDIDNILSSLRFPLDEEEYSSFESIIFSFINATFPSISDLQRVRVKGILEEIVNDLNNKTLTASLASRDTDTLS